MSAPVLERDDTELRPSAGGRPNMTVRLLIFIALLAVTGGFAFFDLYSTFKEYDDEGYMLRAVGHFVDGHRLYDDIRTPYGPVYFLYQWVIHVPAGLPLTNDAVRVQSLLLWVLTATLCALAVAVLTRSLPFAILAYLATFFHLRSYPHEPGHPQELVGLLLAVVLLLPAFRRLNTDRGRLVLAGILGGATAVLLLVKINVGVLLGTSLLVAGASALAPGWLRSLARFFTACAALALPWVLMLGSIRAPNEIAPRFAHLALLVNFATVPLLLYSWWPAPRPWEGLLGARHIVCAAISFATVLCLVIAIVLGAGSTLAGLFESMIAMPRRFTAEFAGPPNAHWVSLVWASLTCAAALIYLVRWRRLGSRTDSRMAAAGAVLKIAFGCLVVWAAFKPYHVPNRVVMLGTPCVWLLLVPPVPSAPLARLVMACVAVLQILQIYPVPGSQLAFGSLAVVPVAMICLVDGFDWLRATASMPHPVRRARWSAVTAAVVSLYAIGAIGYDFAQTCRRYSSEEPLGLPGAAMLRMPGEKAATYRKVTETLRTSADCFIATTGMNSLYLWTGEAPPNDVVIGSELKLFTPKEQIEIFDALMSHSHPMVVHDVKDGPDETRPLMKEIGQAFRVSEKIGRYEIWVPRAVRRTAAE